MKRVLVIGENSYIGKSFEAFAKDRYEIKMGSSRNDAWKSVDFRGYDSVLHCAGIAHVSRNPKMETLYYKVNCDLTVDVAEKAKVDGVKQFIFLSSMLVYDSSTSEIDSETIPNPDNFYGGSKLKAEQELQKLANNNFKLCIVRPPMVYGKGCKGNFPKLVKLAKVIPIFPDIDNRRSMLHIDNLCEFIRLMIDNEERGLFFPQNREYIKTSEMVRLIAETHGKHIRLTKIFNPVIKSVLLKIDIFKKVFGSMYYTMEISEYKTPYQIRDIGESIKKTEL